MGWKVPGAIAPPADEPYWTSLWAGIGSGVGNFDMLVQAGSISNSGPGAVWNIGQYSGTEAFFESYPKENAQIIDELKIHGGDSMFVSVLQSGGGTTVDYIVCDRTTNQCAYPSETLSGGDATGARQAEYILERPSLGENLSKLSPFSPETITGAGGQATTSSSTQETFRIGQSNANLGEFSWTMEGCDGSILAVPGDPDANGNFSVVFRSGGQMEPSKC